MRGRLFSETDLHLIVAATFVQQQVASESRGWRYIACCDQVFRILSYSGRGHFTIHLDPRICLAVGRDSGLYESIDRSIESRARAPPVQEAASLLLAEAAAHCPRSGPPTTGKAFDLFGFPSSVNRLCRSFLDFRCQMGRKEADVVRIELLGRDL